MPVFQHGKNAFLALGYETSPYATTSGTITSSTVVSATFPSTSLWSPNNPLVAGQTQYGMFVNGCPTWSSTTPTPGSAQTTITLGAALASGATSGSATLTPMVNVSPWLNDVGLPFAVDATETTTFSAAGVKTYIVGLKGYTLSFSGLYDPTAPASSGYTGGIDKMAADIEAFQDFQNNATFVSFVYGPSNPGTFLTSASASVKYYGQGIFTKYELKSSVSGAVTFDAEIQVTGAVLRTNL